MKSKIRSVGLSLLLKWLFPGLLVLMISCGQKKETTEGPVHIDLGIERSGEKPFTAYVKEYTIIPLETKEGALIARIEKIVFAHDRFFILNRDNTYRNNIAVFSKEGKYFGRIDRQGRGPEEYTAIADLDAHPDGNRISVLDAARRVIYDYRIDNAQYVSRLNLDFWAKEFKYTGNAGEWARVLATHSSKSSEKGNDMDIYVIGKDDRILYSAFPFSKPSGVHFGNGITLQRVGGGVHYLRPGTDTIYSVSRDTVVPAYLMDFPHPVLPEEKAEDLFRNRLKGIEKYTYNIIFFENEKEIYLRFITGGRSYHAFYHKAGKEQVLFCAKKNQTCQFGDINLRVIGTTPDQFILETGDGRISDLIRTLDPDRKKCTDPDVLQEMENRDETQNPVLVLLNVDW